jgi:glycosyltransferase involved in cell wall biosynthesis
VIIPSFNNEKWVERNLLSLFQQRYPFWRAIYLDDCSEDQTSVMVHALISKYHMEGKVSMVQHSTKHRQGYNRWLAFHQAQDDEVCVLLDGDDWLCNSWVFERLNQAYLKHNLVASYGQFYYWAEGRTLSKSGINQYPSEVIQQNGYRRHPIWVAMHLRTGLARLFKQIPVSYLQDHRGKWLECATDMAEMFAILEMSNGRHMNLGFPALYYNKQASQSHPNSYYRQQDNPSWKHYREEVVRRIRELPRLEPVECGL